MELPTDPLESFRKRNPHLYPAPAVAPENTKSAVQPKKCEFSHVGFRIVICGQIRGGKNNIIITRTGRRFPNPKWAAWRDAAVMEVQMQLPRGFAAFTQPVNVRLDYVAGDHRRRDNPAIVDAIWHCLEKAGVVSDDVLLWPTESSRSYDKDNPRATITFL
jgi:Holliday junction resolvase RusA-like endonuclease